MTDHPIDDLAAYALGALEPDEARAVGAHLESCARCVADVRAYSDTAWTIAESRARDVPPGLRDAIVARARADARPVRGTSWSSRLLALVGRPVPLAAALALAVLLVVATTGYVVAQRDAARYGAALAAIPGARIVALAPTGEVTGARGSLVVPQNGDAPYLILDLPDAPSGKTWEAWVIRGQTAIPAGITDARGITTLVLRATVSAGDTIAVTAEPAGGRDQPSGKPVLAGQS
ncbi:MAG TPA: anti-sigma factor [Candidatus Acidoferrales bacterium]|nr:anti-sigma factor [Candidatus Acidoferrales bacterium]